MAFLLTLRKLLFITALFLLMKNAEKNYMAHTCEK